MKEIGILYSTPMILAKLAGRKTVTRRPVTVDDLIAHPQRFRYAGNSDEMEVPKPAIKYDDRVWYQWELANNNGPSWVERCRWKKGDILYARENFRVARWNHEDGEVSFRYEADGTESDYIGFEDEKIFNKYWQQSCDDLYKAGYESDENECFVDYKPEALRLRPNIFLPKAASRVWERVISVRPERLGDITEEDAVREGILKIDFGLQTPAGSASIDGGKTFHPFKPQRVYGYSYDPDAKQENTLQTARSAFINLWQSIHGPESWNPDLWVWRLETEIISTTGRPENL